MRTASRPERRGIDFTLSRRGDRAVRRGFALLAALWIVVAITVVTLSIAKSAHFLMYGSRNRTNARVASWQALGCFAHIRAKLANDLDTPKRVAAVWDSLDVYATAQHDGCRDTAFASGALLDVNHASERTMRLALDAAGVQAALIDSAIRMSAAGGHRAYGSVEEMRAATAGLMQRIGADSLIGVDTGPLNTERMSLPVRLAVEASPFGKPPHMNTDSFSPDSPSFPRLLPRSPVAWWLRIEASAGDPPISVRLEVHVIRLGGAIGIEDIRL